MALLQVAFSSVLRCFSGSSRATITGGLYIFPSPVAEILTVVDESV